MDAASKLLNGPYRPHGREEVKGRIERENTKICLICGEEVGLRDDGELFVACYGCGLPVCQLCYEYERAQGNHSCPHCQVRYKRNEGCPRVPGDEDDDVTDLGALDDEYQVKGHEDNQQRSRASGPSFLHEDEDHQRQQWHPTVPAFPTSAGSVAASDRAVNDDKATHGDTEWKARVEKWKARQERTRGSAVNPDGGDDGGGEGNEEERVLMAEARQPLWRKVPIPASRINPYRIVVVLRLVALGFFLHFRVTNPAEDAYPLWLVSVICEIWFALSWILDQFPKWFPINRETYLDRLSLRFDREGEPSRLAAVDVFVSTVDPLKEPPIVTANTVLSVLAVDYPVGKISCYVSDDGASMLLFDALSETAEFARRWVPFCKKHCVEPRAPEFYFSQKIDYLKDKVQPSFVRDRRAMKREYEEFKVRINALVAKAQKVPEEGWVMQDGSPWPGNNPRDHPGMIQVYLGNQGALDVEGAELPRLVYVSREKRPGYHHHKKAGAMNALVRVSAVLTNAPFVLNLDCDHYINNCQAIKEAMCFLMDPQLGKKLCFVQFPQRFDGIDPNDRYANRNVVFFDINMRGLDGIQGPVYVGTGCVFNRQALYGYDPPAPSKRSKMTCDCWASWCGRWCCCCPGGTRRSKSSYTERSGGFLRGSKHRKMKRESRWRKGPPALVLDLEEIEEGIEGDEVSERSSLMSRKGFEKRFGQSPAFITSTLMEGGGIPPGGADSSAPIKEAIHVISCGYEERTEWGREIGWIYGSVTEDILTGFKMHCRGWKSAYCMPARAAFKGSAPINLSDRLHQVLRWALGSVEIFLSRHCPLWYGYGGRLKWLERLAYTNTIVYPFTSVPLLAYCTVPAVCLLTGKFIIPAVSLPPPFAADYIIQPPLSRLTRGTADGPGERLVCGPLPLHRRHRRAGAAVERGEHPGLVAERAVLGHRRRLRPPLRRLPGPPQGPRRRRHQLHRHLEGRRRLRFRRALPPQVDLPPRPSDHPPHPQHHRPRRRSLGGRQQRLLLLGPALREALLRLLGHRPPLPVPQGPPREAEPDADSGGALVHPPRLRPLSGVGPHRPLPPQAAGPNSQAMRSRVLTRPK